MSATACVGAIWTSTSPDFGYESVMNRFGQAEPVIFFSSDGYYYNGKTIDLVERVSRIAESLDTVKHWVSIPLIHSGKDTLG